MTKTINTTTIERLKTLAVQRAGIDYALNDDIQYNQVTIAQALLLLLEGKKW